ncbi:MAG: glycosyltransferase family 4 protein [Patescibacteria group bacterium]
MMKPRVIMLSAFLSPFRSGAEACAEEIALRLADKFDITIVTAKLGTHLPRRDSLQGKIAVRRVGFGIPFDKWLYPFLAPVAVRFLQRAPQRGAPTPPLVVHAVLETFAGLALHFCRFLVPKAKRLLTLQTLNRSFLKGPILRSADAVTAISAALKERAESLGRKDVTVIPNGIPLVAIEESVKRMQRLPGRILFVGRLEPMKGVDTLLTAFAQLSKSNFQFPNAHLRIIGDGSERQTLEALAEELRVTDQVQFVGFIPADRIYDEFAQAEIFCGLSRSEALGNVFLEAQAAGCAVIGTTVGGIPEIVKDGSTGLLVPPDDVAAARSALGKLLRDLKLRHDLAERGKENAKKYDWGVIAERYAEVYHAFYGDS